MAQFNMFAPEETGEENIYTNKIKTPIYEPKNKCPHTVELVDTSKVNALISKISEANVTKEEKAFLIRAAKRHLVFNYSKIADYYSHATEEMQNLMEASALVIIDFEKAIEYGYVRLSDELGKLYYEDYPDEE